GRPFLTNEKVVVVKFHGIGAKAIDKVRNRRSRAFRRLRLPPTIYHVHDRTEVASKGAAVARVMRQRAHTHKSATDVALYGHAMVGEIGQIIRIWNRGWRHRFPCRRTRDDTWDSVRAAPLAQRPEKRQEAMLAVSGNNHIDIIRSKAHLGMLRGEVPAPDDLNIRPLAPQPPGRTHG